MLSVYLTFLQSGSRESVIILSGIGCLSQIFSLRGRSFRQWCTGGRLFHFSLSSVVLLNSEKTKQVSWNTKEGQWTLKGPKRVWPVWGADIFLQPLGIHMWAWGPEFLPGSGTRPILWLAAALLSPSCGSHVVGQVTHWDVNVWTGLITCWRSSGSWWGDPKLSACSCWPQLPFCSCCQISLVVVLNPDLVIFAPSAFGM